MRFSASAFILLFTAGWFLKAQSIKRSPASQPPATSVIAPEVAPEIRSDPVTEKLSFGVEWSLTRAGTVVVEARPDRLEMRVESAGIVSKLLKVDDFLTVNYDEMNCATSSFLDSTEGKRHRETRVTYDRQKNHAFFEERDVINRMVIRETGTDTPNCVLDALGALAKLRMLKLEPGQSAQIPVSDGRRFAAVKVDALERDEVKTAGATYHTVRYQAALMSGVIYARKGRLLVWVSEDARRLPVQIQLQMSFPFGTITLQLEKEEHP